MDFLAGTCEGSMLTPTLALVQLGVASWDHPRWATLAAPIDTCRTPLQLHERRKIWILLGGAYPAGPDCWFGSHSSPTARRPAEGGSEGPI